MIKLARGIENNKEIRVEVIDAKYSETSVEVRILEGRHEGRLAIVNKEDLVAIKKESVRLVWNKWEDDSDSELGRAMNITLEATSERALEELLMYLEAHKDAYGLDFGVFGCTYEDEDRYCDVVSIDFDFGGMGRAKREFKALMKDAKRALNLR